MSETGDSTGALGSAARDAALDLVREVVGKLDLDTIERAEVDRGLAELESAARQAAVAVEVTSAVPLTAAERTRLEQRLRATAETNMAIAYHVDPSIIGGLIVRIGNRKIDGSVAARLGEVRAWLARAAEGAPS